jgi:hypothetical protein
MSKATFARCVFLPAHHRPNLPNGSVVYDVSSYGDPPYCTLSPMWVHGGIPIPGSPSQTSDTVEGIWQGLKIIRGKTATRYFRGPGQKRGGKPSGHQYGKTQLGIVEARLKIYRVAYEWMLENRADPNLIQHFLAVARSGIPQHFHDVGSNGDLNDADQPLAHAAVLVQYLNRKLLEEADA